MSKPQRRDIVEVSHLDESGFRFALLRHRGHRGAVKFSGPDKSGFPLCSNTGTAKLLFCLLCFDGIVSMVPVSDKVTTKPDCKKQIGLWR